MSDKTFAVEFSHIKTFAVEVKSYKSLKQSDKTFTFTYKKVGGGRFIIKTY